MREYTQADIDSILAHDEIQDDKHKWQVYDVRYLCTIDYITNEKRYDVSISKLNDLLQQAWDNATKEEHWGVLNVEAVIESLDNEQGLRTFDYERNVWRVAYTFKSIQLSEEEDRQGKTPTKPNDLIDNFKENELRAFEDTFERLEELQVTTQSVIGYLKLLKEIIGLDDIQRVIDKFELDLDLMDIIHEEAKNTSIFVVLNFLNHYENNDLDRDDITDGMIANVMTPRVETHQRLFTIPDLKNSLLKEADYNRVASDYKELSYIDVVQKMPQIFNDFKGVILSG